MGRLYTKKHRRYSLLVCMQLLARIERMERRLQLVKKDSRDKRLFQPLEPWTPDKDDDLEGVAGDSTPVYTPKTSPFGRGGKGHKRYRQKWYASLKCAYCYYVQNEFFELQKS